MIKIHQLRQMEEENIYFTLFYTHGRAKKGVLLGFRAELLAQSVVL